MIRPPTCPGNRNRYTTVKKRRMGLAPLVQNMKPLLLEDRLWTFSALRVSNCILRKTNANLRPENRTMQAPNHRPYNEWLLPVPGFLRVGPRC